MSATYVEVAVDTVDAVVARANPGRQRLLVSNPTANNLYLAFGQTAVVGQSLLIPPGHGPVELGADQFGALPNTDIHAIFATAAGHAAVIVISD